MVPFSFCTHELVLLEGHGSRPGALYWPAERALLVADLHLEKASFYASGGQMLPPYDSRETLERLADALRVTGARRVFALGDNFHDDAGPARLEPHATGMLDALTRAHEWVWITGNHDRALGSDPARTLPGTCHEELELAGIMLRHETRPDTPEPELSGHFHPRLTLTARGRRIARACTVASETRLILPAFGALTGGMPANDPAILEALQPAEAIDALLPSRARLVRFPLWRKAA
ncbi:ligase-associated DNA damage response endonuclease PdeM [Novosphingobium sp. 1949]|uniref:Ligase-associated DNA damage response endonuclease PdeM n=1 Tax=Novosphingobium organovorum TaxID=2930092 RepID=A0ABT0BG35_9SPHN|nr:ligase-associated DNA damage response endonuclease PdeM [Novosphingobium organovorum]MCJ2184030.1 ligase-associated DNA damage response endonuclease PdeM [Novosphingobium organovorum]